MNPFRIMVVDDDPDIRSIIELAMRYEGVDVTEAENGAVALEKLQSDPVPCAILLDLMMPVMDGWILSQKMAADSRLKNIPVVLMTAFDEGGRKLPESAALLRKPMSLQTIRDAVRKFCAPHP